MSRRTAPLSSSETAKSSSGGGGGGGGARVVAQPVGPGSSSSHSFGPKEGFIKSNPEFDVKGRAKEWFEAMEALVKRCANV